MAGNFTFFSNDAGSAAGPTDYVRDVFQDVSLPASNNTSLTDNANTNPFGKAFANDDRAIYQEKTLFIKDLVLISDRSKWVDNTPTYQVIFTESFPSVYCYMFGDIQIAANQGEVSSDGPQFEADCKVVTVKTIGGGFGVNGVVRRVGFLLNDFRSGTGTGQVVVDGTNGNTITFSSLATGSDDSTAARFSMFVHKSSDETDDLHDIKIKANEAGTLKVLGVVLSFNKSTIAVNPGITYVDKNKISTTAGTTFAIPSFGSSLGGNILVYKTTSSGYATSAKSFSACISIAQGSSGTNLLSVSTGHGASFPVGTGIAMSNGTSMYVGSVTSVSTDTLTVAPTLTFGLSNSIYRAWIAGPTLAINASFFALSGSIDFSKNYKISGGFTGILDLKNSLSMFSKNIGSTQVNNETAAVFLGASGFIQVDGSFSAADIEFTGSGTLHATLSVNGTPGWGVNTGHTGTFRRTVFSEAGSGWNSLVFSPGASFNTGIGIAKINVYKRIPDQGITLGSLGFLNINPAITERTAINTTLMSLGTSRRLYSDQMYLNGSWVRGATHSSPGGMLYYGASTSSSFEVQYYGKDFAVLGTPGGGTLSIDGVGTGLTFGFFKSVSTYGFHKVNYTVGSGGTCIIQGFDFTSPYGEMTSLQNVLITPAIQSAVDAQKVVAVYSISADIVSAFSDNATFGLNYDLRHIDTHHAVHPGAGSWSFQCPRSGMYNITAGWVDSLAGGSVYNIQSRLVVNGTTVFTEIRSGTTASTVTTAGVSGNWTTFLRQGDIVTILAYGKENASGSHTIIAGTGNCVFRAVEL